jgi:hypothetical protein
LADWGTFPAHYSGPTRAAAILTEVFQHILCPSNKSWDITDADHIFSNSFSSTFLPFEAARSELLSLVSYKSVTIIVTLDIIHRPVFLFKTMFLRLDSVPVFRKKPTQLGTIDEIVRFGALSIGPN